MLFFKARRYYEGAYELACANRSAGDAEFYEFICKDFGNTCCLYARVLQERMLESNDFVKVSIALFLIWLLSVYIRVLIYAGSTLSCPQ